MKTKDISLFFLFLAMLFLFAGCQKSSELILKEIGPSNTKAGQAFNVQPDGSAAMWAITNNATENTLIMWGDRKLVTALKSGKIVTALVPKELYSRPGQYRIYLMDSKTGAKSNSLVFTVTE